MTFDNLLGYILSISMCMQSFITIVHSVRPFSLFQNLELGTASTDVKCHFAISWARFGNLSVYIMSVVMDMQNCIEIYQMVQEIGPVSLFSYFEPRQNLDQSQMTFDNLTGYILSISMRMQNFITIFFTAQENFTFFRIWSSAKPHPKKNASSQSFWLDLVNINAYANVYQNIPLSSRDRAIFTFFQNLAVGKASTDDKCHFAILGLDLFNIKLSAKFYQNIPNSLRVKFHFFSEFEPRQNFDQSQV